MGIGTKEGEHTKSQPQYYFLAEYPYLQLGTYRGSRCKALHMQTEPPNLSGAGHLGFPGRSISEDVNVSQTACQIPRIYG